MNDNLNARLKAVIAVVQAKYPTTTLYEVDTDQPVDIGLDYDGNGFCWGSQRPYEFDDPNTNSFGAASSSKLENGFVKESLGNYILLYYDWSTVQ